MTLKILNTNSLFLAGDRLKAMTHEILILNRHHETPSRYPRHYIGRGSVMGNPYPIDRDKSRDQVCDLYEQWWETNKTDPVVKETLGIMCNQIKEHGGIELMCFCAPKRCHGETIKRELQRMLEP